MDMDNEMNAPAAPEPEELPTESAVPESTGPEASASEASEPEAATDAAVTDATATDTAAADPAAAGVAAGLEIGSEAVAEGPRLPTTLRGRVEKDGTAIGTGRRKTAVARVRLRKGSGKITVNDRPFEEYFPVERQRLMIEAPLQKTGMLGKVDIAVRASGGGINGQAGAMILGIARAIQALEPEQHGPLSDGGFLTRDDRMVERKKYGHKKARRSFQFSKR
jgi:small subunit ribosomal protein S9